MYNFNNQPKCFLFFPHIKIVPFKNFCFVLCLVPLWMSVKREITSVSKHNRGLKWSLGSRMAPREVLLFFYCCEWFILTFCLISRFLMLWLVVSEVIFYYFVFLASFIDSIKIHYILYELFFCFWMPNTAGNLSCQINVLECQYCKEQQHKKSTWLNAFKYIPALTGRMNVL